MKTLGLLALMAVILISCLYLLFDSPINREQAEQYAVYSAYITSRLTCESHSLGCGDGLVVIFSSTSPTNALEPASTIVRCRVLLYGLSVGKRFPSIRTSTLLSFVFVNLRSMKLDAKFVLPAKYALATTEDVRRFTTFDFEKRFPNSYGYITLSKVGFSRDGRQALFYTEHSCGLCGNGEYVLMIKANGHWTIQKESYTWIS